MKSKLLLLISLVFCGIFANAQTYNYIHLWSGAVPGATTAKHPPVYTGTTDATIVYTDINDPTYVVYKPAVTINNGCGIIVCSGGGYSQISTMSDVAGWLNTLGFTAFTLQYRVKTNMRAGVAAMDIQRAVRMIRSKAVEYGINPNKLGVMGLSAGGNLCIRGCTRFNIDEYPKDPTDPIDQVSSRPDYAVLLYPAYLDLDSPMTSGITVNSSTPPMFHCVAVNDVNQYNSSVVFNAALKSANATFEYHEFPDGGHGFIFTGTSTAVKQWPGLAQTWLQKTINSLPNAIQAVNINKTIDIYPNPVRNQQFNLVMNSTCNDASLNITDLAGRIVYTQKLQDVDNQIIRLKGTNLQTGIYCVKVIGSNFNYAKLLSFE